MKINTIVKKANSLKGCLSHLETTKFRRKQTEEEDLLIFDNPPVSDEAKIKSSKSWRTLKDKTQVFTKARNSLIRDRRSHVDEVVSTSVVTSEILGLNTDLTRAAALGHDIGHVPFGHQGEHWMVEIMGKPEFCHEIMGTVVTQHIERAGRGLNLCHETLVGMLCHSGNTSEKFGDLMTQEAWVLRHADKFAYIFHDINDIFIRMQYPMPSEIKKLLCCFGENQRERTTTAQSGLVIESAETGKVSFEESDLGKKFKTLRKLMYSIYPSVTRQDVGEILEPLLEFINNLNLGDPFLILSLMTDSDVINLWEKPMRSIDDFKQTAVWEIVPHLEQIGKVDMCNPDLDW